jgi:hypothetical protein
MEKLPIDEVKKLISSLAKVSNKVDDALEDDKITKAEGIGIALSSLPDLFNVISNGKAIKAEFKDIDAEERKELIEFAANEFDLSNDQAEEAIEDIFAAALYLQSGIKKLVE